MNEINKSNISEDTYADINVILNMMPNSMLEKINKKFIEFVKNKESNSTGLSNINPYLPLKDQKLSKETEAILALIYDAYFNNEEIKTDLFDNNYNKTPIDNKSDSITSKEDQNNNLSLSLVEKKDGFIIKIFNIIRNVFNRKK